MAAGTRYPTPAPLYVAPAPRRRCEGCGGFLNASRPNSRFEMTCNILLNPKAASGDLFEAVRTPRARPDRRVESGWEPDWEKRLAGVRRLHAARRGAKPGWGRLGVTELQADLLTTAQLQRLQTVGP